VDQLASGVRHAVWIFHETEKLRQILPDVRVSPQIQEIVRAVDEAQPVDSIPPELLRWIQQETLALKCNFMYTVLQRVGAMFDAYLEVDNMLYGIVPESDELGHALVEVMRKLEKYCASRGLRFDDDDDESGEDQQTASELQNT